MVTKPHAWKFVATLLVNNDAQSIGFERFSAPDLFTQGDDTYLWVSPGSDSPFEDSYNGCRAFRFASLVDGQLTTNADDELPVTGSLFEKCNVPGMQQIKAAGDSDGFFSGFGHQCNAEISAYWITCSPRLRLSNSALIHL